MIRKSFLFYTAAVLCLFLSIFISTQTVRAAESYTVTYHANGGTFEGGSDTNVVTYGPATEKVTKTSKTSNVSDDGSSYSGGYGNNKTITDKVTIPGAKELKVTITYATESTSYDWVCVYDGKTTPSTSNYSSSVSGKLGGGTKTTKTFIVTGDTAQFFFRSDGSNSNYYGYYATVEWEEQQKVLSGTYQESITTEKDMRFDKWYTDKDCTAGKEFVPENVTKSQDVYAKYVKTTIASGTTGEVTWKLYENGMLKLYPTNGVSGTMENFELYNSAPWFDYKTQIKSVKIEKGVKAGIMCSNMFYNCSKLVTADVKELDTGNVTSMSSMFDCCSNLTNLEIGGWNTGNVTAMSYMFSNCRKLANLDIDGWNTGDVTRMNSMFWNCSKLTSLDIGSWNTSNVNDMNTMFWNCSKLTSLDIGSWNTGNVTDMSYMFNGCSSLTSLEIGGWNTGNVKDMSDMFYNCSNLTSLEIGGWNTGNVTTMKSMFKYCRKLITIRLSDKIKSDIINQLPAKDWLHTRTLDGTKLYDKKTYTTAELAALSMTDAAGTWKVPYTSGSTKNPDGTYEYVTDDDLWTQNGDAWTYTFDVFDDSVPFYFWEENLSGFSSDLMIKSDGLLNTVGTTGTSKTGTVTNKKNVDSSSLKISKTVIGGDTETKFKFTIMLTGDHIKDACEYSDVLFTKGVGSITLKDGESKIIEGIPAGTAYSVEETQTGLYRSSSTNAAGTIEKDQIKEAAFTNIKIKDEQPSEDEVNVTVSKKVLPEKNIETEKYQMSAALTGLKPDTSYALSDSTEFTSDSNGNGYVEFALAQDEEVAFLHLPVGCTYQITEAAGAYTSSYEVTDDQNTGTIAKNEDSNTKENQELSTGKETAEAGENVKVTFTNEVQYLQNLTLVKKTVKSNGSDYDSKDSFSFTIAFSNLKPGEIFSSSIGKIKADEEGTAEKTFFLKNGEKAEFYKIPSGTKYQITEEKNDYKPSYKIDAKTIVKKENSGKEDQDFSTENETIDIGENDVITFINQQTEWFSLPDAGSHALELLAGAAMIALAIGCINRKRFLQKTK